MMQRLIFTTLFACGALACASPSNVEQHFGEAQRHLTQQQIANPDAGREPTDGVTTLEGTTVENVMGRYRKEQTKTPPKSPVSILNISSGGSGSSN